MGACDTVSTTAERHLSLGQQSRFFLTPELAAMAEFGRAVRCPLRIHLSINDRGAHGKRGRDCRARRRTRIYLSVADIEGDVGGMTVGEPR